MERLLDMQKKLIPDVLDVMSTRYRILQSVHFLQPIGRRTLSVNLGITERVLRGEVTFLSQQGLIHMSKNGMSLTSEGEKMVLSLEDVMKDVSGLKHLEKQLETVLDVPSVVIVPGDSDHNPEVKNEMGLACVQEMERCLKPESIIAVTGGTTLAAAAEIMHPLKKKALENVQFVSARGGLGEQVENQANTICAKMAEKAEASYHLLHVPDQLSEESYLTLIEEPSVQKSNQLLQSATMIIHGIGDAKTMALRRNSSQALLNKIDHEHAVAEAFGYYFDQDGRVVHKVKTIGMQLESLYDNRTVIAIAGGRSKARAIQAYFKKGPDSILITDEGAAEEILSLI
ncbi:central glycolytic genes regulator [Scopulibacillus darangshiensis]|uniref:Central glycolytic genes regulator n=1 Tax=Scopulibacillus darangshiensis TaxID=442528 RepID=A0A4R2NTS4_9BACL|nr:sugar-binding domain-containing protein [Scopulibacillus darangshiensis]TCP24858.1 central glycolytic genes regulator [Scopulibacillus darangshiensis]